jgi:hypothetical protein
MWRRLSSLRSLAHRSGREQLLASEDSGQGGRNRLLAALAPKGHSLLAPHLNEMSFELGLLLLADLQKPMRGRDLRMRNLG